MRGIPIPFLLGLALCCGCSRVTDVSPDRYTVLNSYAPAVPSTELNAVKVLTLEKAQEIARLNNPDFLATEHLVNAARMRYYQSLGSYLPEITASYEVGQSLMARTNIVNPLETTVPSNNTFAPRAGITASWLLFNGFARELEVLIQRKQQFITHRQRENVLRILNRAVAYAYYDVLAAIEMRRIAKADIAFRESSLRQAEIRYTNGFIAKSDLLSMKIDLANAKVLFIRAEEGYWLSRYVLSAILGFPGGNLPEHLIFSPVENVVTHPGMGVDFYLDEAVQRRPDLEIARASVMIRQWAYRQVLSTFFPTAKAYAAFDFQTFGDVSRDAGDRTFHNYNSYSGSYGVYGEWLIFNGFRRWNRYRELLQTYEESKLRVASQALQVFAEVESAYTTFASNALCATYLRDTMEWVFEQRNLVNTQYWAGKVTITRLRGVQSDLVNAESNLVTSIINIRKADAQLVAAAGGLLDLPPDTRGAGSIDKLFDYLAKKFPY